MSASPRRYRVGEQQRGERYDAQSELLRCGVGAESGEGGAGGGEGGECEEGGEGGEG